MNHKHVYQRLSDDAIFCAYCGDIKRSEPSVCTRPHYPYLAPVVYPPAYPTIPSPWRPTVYPTWIATTPVRIGSSVSSPSGVIMSKRDWEAIT